MITFLAIIHILACVVLVGLVLIQDSKGGGVFTSQTSNSVLGATGASSLAENATKVMGVVFAATCIGLSIMASRSEKSVVDSVPAATSSAQAPTAADATAPTADKATTATPAQPAQPAANETK